MRPKISIGFNSGVIGAVQPLNTGCFALVASAVAVENGFQLETPYQVKNLKDIANLKLSKREKARNYGFTECQRIKKYPNGLVQ